MIGLISLGLYASFVSVLNFSGILSEYAGALSARLFGVTKDDFTNLAWLMLFCTSSSLLPLCFLRLLPEGNVQDVVKQEEEDHNEESIESTSIELDETADVTRRRQKSSSIELYETANV